MRGSCGDCGPGLGSPCGHACSPLLRAGPSVVYLLLFRVKPFAVDRPELPPSARAPAGCTPSGGPPWGSSARRARETASPPSGLHLVTQDQDDTRPHLPTLPCRFMQEAKVDVTPKGTAQVGSLALRWLRLPLPTREGPVSSVERGPRFGAGGLVPAGRPSLGGSVLLLYVSWI